MACKAKRAAAAREFMAVKAMTRLATASPSIKTNWQNHVEQQEQKKMKKSLLKLAAAVAEIESIGLYASKKRIFTAHLQQLSAAADVAAELNSDGRVIDRSAFELPESVRNTAKTWVKQNFAAGEKTAAAAELHSLQSDFIDAAIDDVLTAKTTTKTAAELQGQQSELIDATLDEVLTTAKHRAASKKNA